MNTPVTLAHHVDYRRLAVAGREVCGEIEISRLPRVVAETAASAGHSGVAAVDLRFNEDRQRRVYVAGQIETTLTLVCQRCLTPFDSPMSVQIAGVVVADDESAASVPREDEPILADGDMLDLHALVADELLLALPSVARCERAACVSQFEHEPSESERQTHKPKSRDNPFAVLSQLKRDE